MPQYLLPCDCGSKLRIDLGQAGQRITCECGKVLEAPPMRGIRELEPVATTSEETPPREWSFSQGISFLASALLVCVSLIVALYCTYAYSQLDLSYSEEAHTASELEAIDTMAPARLFDEWIIDRDEGLYPIVTPQHIRDQRAATTLSRVGIVAGIVLLAGIGLGIFACLAPQQQSRQ